MTLVRYAPEDLDQIALRMLDVAARVRGLAQLCRQEKLAGVALHTKKAEDWLGKLETWSLRVSTELDVQVAQQKAERLVTRVRQATDPSMANDSGPTCDRPGNTTAYSSPRRMDSG